MIFYLLALASGVLTALNAVSLAHAESQASQYIYAGLVGFMVAVFLINLIEFARRES